MVLARQAAPRRPPRASTEGWTTGARDATFPNFSCTAAGPDYVCQAHACQAPATSNIEDLHLRIELGRLLLCARPGDAGGIEPSDDADIFVDGAVFETGNVDSGHDTMRRGHRARQRRGRHGHDAAPRQRRIDGWRSGSRCERLRMTTDASRLGREDAADLRARLASAVTNVPGELRGFAPDEEIDVPERHRSVRLVERPAPRVGRPHARERRLGEVRRWPLRRRARGRPSARSAPRKSDSLPPEAPLGRPREHAREELDDAPAIERQATRCSSKTSGSSAPAMPAAQRDRVEAALGDAARVPHDEPPRRQEEREVHRLHVRHRSSRGRGRAGRRGSMSRG